MSIKDDVNSIVKPKKIKEKIGDLNPQSDRDSTRNVGKIVDTGSADGGGVGIVSPVVMDVLTMEEMPCVDMPNCSVYRALTFKLTDAEGTEIDVSEINWPVIAP